MSESQLERAWPRPCGQCTEEALIVNGGEAWCPRHWAVRCGAIENPCDCAGCRAKVFGGDVARYVAEGVIPYVAEPNAAYFDEVDDIPDRKSVRRIADRRESPEKRGR